MKKKKKVKAKVKQYILSIRIPDGTFKGGFMSEMFKFRSKKQRDSMSRICYLAGIDYITSEVT